MYHLQRGPLLDPRFCHADERALLQSCFLAAPAEHAAPMLLPALHVLNQETGYFEAAAPANLALLPGAPAHARPCLPALTDAKNDAQEFCWIKAHAAICPCPCLVACLPHLEAASLSQTA